MAHLPVLICKILSEPYQDEKITALGKDSAIAPTVVKVLNLDTQEEALLVVNAIIASAFLRAGGSIVGRYFSLKSGNIRDGKKYRDILVDELEISDGNDASTAAG